MTHTALPPATKPPGVMPPAPEPAGGNVLTRQVGVLRTALEDRLVGTPGRLRVVGGACVLACLVFALLGASAFQARAHALADARADAAQLVRVQSIRTNLVQADANATNAFLRGGLEPPALRASYEQGVAAASALITSAARANPADAPELGRVNQALSQYTGLIATARANNRQGFPVGSAYLRQASTVLRGQILPALARVNDANAARVAASYDDAANAWLRLGLAAVIGLGVLGWGQLWLARRTHRMVNTPLAAATAGVLLAVIGGGFVLVAQQSAAERIGNGSYQAAAALAQARIAAFDAKSNESLTLIQRGSGSAYETAWKAGVDEARTQLQRAVDAGVDPAVVDTLDTWVTVHQQIRKFDDRGEWEDAVGQATGTGANNSNAAFQDFADTTQQALGREASAVADGLASVRLPLVIAGWLVLAIGILAAVGAWWGFTLRLEEYR
jgi:hypothetical protein